MWINNIEKLEESEPHHITWKGVKIEIIWKPECFGGVIAHLQINANWGYPLPMTETGYRSHFTQREEIEVYGWPVQYVQAWLDELDDGKPVQYELF